PLLGPTLELARVRWRPEDALVNSLPVGIDRSEGEDEVAVARGNIVPAHHGRLIDGPAGTTLEARPPLEGGPVGEFWLKAAGAPADAGRSAGPGLSLETDGTPYRLDVNVTLPSTATLRGS